MTTINQRINTLTLEEKEKYLTYCKKKFKELFIDMAKANPVLQEQKDMMTKYVCILEALGDFDNISTDPSDYNPDQLLKFNISDENN